MTVTNQCSPAAGVFRPYSWRHAFMKATLSPIAKLVLHTIAAHFGEAGEPAYPKIVTIARKSSLSERAVKKHLRGLSGTWVHVERLPLKGEPGTRYHYLPRYPGGLIDFDRDDLSGAPRARAPRAPAQYKEPVKKNKTSPNPIPLESEMGQWFEEFFKAYPNQAAKLRAWKTLSRINPDAALRAQILEGLRRWKATSDPKAAPFASTWLRFERWREGIQRRIPWICKTCGRAGRYHDGRDYWCREHDPAQSSEASP